MKLKYSLCLIIYPQQIIQPLWFPFGVLTFDCWGSLASSPEKEELKSVPLDTRENNLVKASVGEELETTHLNEVWDHLWINIDRVLNKNITQNVQVI